MNTERIQLRPLTKADYPAAENIIRQTWHYDDICKSSVTARRLARLYLRGCLMGATYSCVAEMDGQILGLILARSDHDKMKGKLRAGLSEAGAVIALLSGREGRKVCKMFGGFSKIDDELLKSTGDNFDGEVCLFAVTEAARGLGIGKMLFGAMKAYMYSQHVKNIYLFTDTTCTYQFYEKRGLRRLAGRAVKLPEPIHFKLHMFVYGTELAAISL